jgi:hypothetical protein
MVEEVMRDSNTHFVLRANFLDVRIPSKESDRDLKLSEAILFGHLAEALLYPATKELLTSKYPTLVKYFEYSFNKYFLELPDAKDVSLGSDALSFMVYHILFCTQLLILDTFHNLHVYLLVLGLLPDSVFHRHC